MSNFDFVIPKTDLADESDEIIKSQGKEPDGLESVHERIGETDIFTMYVKNSCGERTSGKRIGRYTTVSTGNIAFLPHSEFKKLCSVLSLVIGQFVAGETGKDISKLRTLTVGLGNRTLTADAVGYETVKNFIVTRHIKENSHKLFCDLGLSETCALLPDVLGNTGIEAADIVKGVCECVNPDLIIAVDSLSSRRMSRVAATVQICSTGICPGSGVENSRKEISKETMGVPVIGIGIPTVVNSATLLYDILGENAKQLETAKAEFEKELDCYVTPKDSEVLIKSISKLTGYSINLALHKNLTVDEIPDFL